MSKKRTQSHGSGRPASHAAHGGSSAHKHGSGAGSSAAPAEGETGHEHDDDFIVVPKGESRLSFYFKLGLVMFLLIIFVVPGALMSSLSGDDVADKVFVSWTGPDGGRRELNYTDFVQRKRELSTLNETAPAFTRMRDMGNLDLLGLGQFDPKDEFDAARYLLLLDIAEHQGLRSTTQELSEAVRNLFGGVESYRAELAARRSYVTPSEFEDALGEALVVRRFLGYLAAGAATAEPDEVLARWRSENQQYAFDYVELATEDFAEAARAELPEDEGLQAWLDGLSDRRKANYHSPVRWSAEFAYVPLGPMAQEAWSYEALLEKYPRPEDEDPEVLARRYYDAQISARFSREEPLEEAEDPQDKLYFPFEEVRETALREAPVYFALQDWHADLTRRMAAPAEEGDAPAPVDFVAEAAEFGLELAEAGEPKSAEKWFEEEFPWGAKDTRLPGRMGSVGAAGKLVPSVSMTADAMVVTRIAERLDRSMPPFEEIRERVADDWVKERQTTLATEALESLRDVLGERPPEPEDGSEAPAFEPVVTAEAFAQAAQEMGYEVKRRDYAEREDPRLGAEGEAPIEEFLSFQPLYFSLEEGEVPSARSDRTGAHAFLLRYAGQRDPDVSKLEPAELETMRMSVGEEKVQAFFERTFRSREFLEERYQFRLMDQRRDEQPEKPAQG